MPYIQIISAWGEARQISSSDNETVGRWLVETLSLFTSPHPAYNDISIDVQPLSIGQEPNAVWDWHPAANQTFTAQLRERTPIENVRALAQAMMHYADEVEEKAERV